MPSTKRHSDAADDDTSLHKIRRTENGDFSGAVKKKLSSASRTGQACDRCKVRHISCVGKSYNTDTMPGSQDPLRCKTGGLFAMHAEQHRMPHHRPYHRASHLTRPHRDNRIRELDPEAVHCRATTAIGREWHRSVPRSFIRRLRKTRWRHISLHLAAARVCLHEDSGLEADELGTILLVLSARYQQRLLGQDRSHCQTSTKIASATTILESRRTTNG